MKMYLGDSVYAEVKHGMVKLTTNNGLKDTNTIYLEAEVYEALEAFVDQVRHAAEDAAKEKESLNS